MGSASRAFGQFMAERRTPLESQLLYSRNIQRNIQGFRVQGSGSLLGGVPCYRGACRIFGSVELL